MESDWRSKRGERTQEERDNRSTGARQESVFHGRGKGGARSARTAGAIHGKKNESARSARRRVERTVEEEV